MRLLTGKCVQEKQCRQRLVVVWSLGLVVMFGILFLQTVFGAYTPHTPEAWGWLLPNLLPTFTLMMGCLKLDAYAKTPNRAHQATLDPFFFRLAVGLSIFYLLTVALTVVMLPFVSAVPDDKVAFLQVSNFWLGPLQSFATAALGFFFVDKSHQAAKQVLGRSMTATDVR